MSKTFFSSLKRVRISSYVMRTKYIVIIFACIFLIVFGRTIETPSLSKTAIVLGVGIDYNEENREFEVSTQTILVGASTGDTSQTTYNNYTGKGKTISGALDDISQKMGLLITLSHCNVLFVSTNALKLDHFHLLYPLIVMYELPEQAIVVSGNQSPREMLAIRVGTTVSSPYFLQSSLLNEEGSDGMIRTTVKNMLARSLSRSKSVVIPYIKTQKLQDQPMTGQENLKDNYEFDLSQSLAFNHSDNVVIEKDMTEILALYFSKDASGTINYTAQNGDSIEFKILKHKVKMEADNRTVSVSIKLSVDVLGIQHVNSNSVLSGADEIVKQYAEQLAKQISDILYGMFELSQEKNIDFLYLQEKVYQSVGRTLEHDCLNTLSFSAKTDITVEEAS